MNRREFLRLLSASIAVLSVPVLSRNATSQVVNEMGSAIPLPPDFSPEDIPNLVLKTLLDDAKSKLNSGGTVEIRAIFNDHSHLRKVAWYTNKEIIKMPPEGMIDPVLIDGSQYLCGRVKI